MRSFTVRDFEKANTYLEGFSMFYKWKYESELIAPLLAELKSGQLEILLKHHATLKMIWDSWPPVVWQK